MFVLISVFLDVNVYPQCHIFELLAWLARAAWPVFCVEMISPRKAELFGDWGTGESC